MPHVTAPNPTVLKAGTYNATFAGIDEKTDGKFDDGRWWLWSFEIPTKSGPKTVTAPTSPRFGPKARARQWATAILGRSIRAGEDLELNDLEGRPCLVQLAIAELDGGEKVNRIEAVTAIPATAAEEDEQDVLA